jgi:hypothetical protein
MISKRVSKFSHNLDELVQPLLAIVMGTGIGLLGCVALNKTINARVLKTCNQNLNQIVYMQTALGDSYGCVSKMVLYGPPAPIKP